MMKLKHLYLLLFFFIHPLIADLLPPTTTLEIPMRDGKILTADVYLPSPDAKNLPCILIRNPAGRKSPTWLVYTPLCKLGYTVVVQDTRSALDQEGKTFPFLDDGWGDKKDGYDTIEWLAKHPLTNGKIGTLGFSACGITQLLAAPTNPPSLKCQYIGQAAGNLFKHAIYPGGQWMKNQVEGWLGLYAKHPDVLKYVITQPFYNKFWERFDTIKVANEVRVPGFMYVGWYDTFLQGTIDSFIARQKQGGVGAKGEQKLVIGPWTHFWPIDKSFGDFSVPKQGQEPPFDISPERWFDYYLKGNPNGIQKLPSVIYYVMGPFDGTASKGNVWKTAQDWPVPAKPISLYLSHEGRLTRQIGALQHEQAYKYQSNDPSPTIGGHNLFLESGPKDQRPLEKRPDVLVFTTEDLKKDIEVTGALSAKIFFKTDQPQSDLVVRLSDVYPDGKSILIADGVLHLKDRIVHQEHPKEYTIDLASTSIVFAKNHRIRISITNSNYPRYDTSNHAEVSQNTLYFGKEFPSRIILPVVQ